jgi:hypothetical protein
MTQNQEIAMKKTFLFLIVAALFVITVPASAAKQTPTGPQIRVDPDGATVHYPADTSFHIMHGWHSALVPGEKPVIAMLAKAGFALELDGSYLGEDYIDRVKETEEETGTIHFYKLFFFNYPNGLSGTHTFTGHWTIECKYWQDECENPHEILEVQTRTITIVFDAP